MKNYVLLIVSLFAFQFRVDAMVDTKIESNPSVQAAQVDNDLKFCELKDKTGFEERYNNLSYHYFLPNGFKQGEVTWNIFIDEYMKFDSIGSILEFKYTDKHPTVRKNKNLVKFKLLNQDSRWRKKRSFFNFEIYNSNYDYSSLVVLFPELVAFKNYVFELDEYQSKRSFYKNYKRGKTYNNVRILYESGDELGTIELKTEKAFIRLNFKVIHTAQNGRKRTDMKFVRAFKKYQVYMIRKKVAFNNYVKLYWKGNSVDKDTYFYRVKILKFKNIDMGANDIKESKSIEISLKKDKTQIPSNNNYQSNKSKALVDIFIVGELGLTRKNEFDLF